MKKTNYLHHSNKFLNVMLIKQTTIDLFTKYDNVNKKNCMHIKFKKQERSISKRNILKKSICKYNFVSAAVYVCV